MGINLLWIWSRESQGLDDAALRFSPRISNGSSIQEVMLFSESTYYFTAPERTSHCEIYNFSVIVTYVGAAYIGTGAVYPVLCLVLHYPLCLASAYWNLP